jgi:hypothetical protein
LFLIVSKFTNAKMLSSGSEEVTVFGKDVVISGNESCFQNKFTAVKTK